MKLNVDCLLWVKTRFPAEANVDPVGFVRTVVLDAQDRGQGKESQIATRTRYLNRLTPVSVMTKATEQGLFEAARATLAPYFELVDKTKEKEQEGSTNAEGVEASSGGDAAPAATDKGEEKKPFTVSCVFRPPFPVDTRLCSYFVCWSLRYSHPLFGRAHSLPM